MLVDAEELRAFRRVPPDDPDWDTDAAELVIELAESKVRAVVGGLLDEAEAGSDPKDEWRVGIARSVVLEHAAHRYPNPDGVLQERVDQIGSRSYADSRHSVTDLTRDQRQRLKVAFRLDPRSVRIGDERLPT